MTPQDKGRGFEKEVATTIGGKAVKGSGSSWHVRGDVITNDYIVSCKATEKKQLILTAAMLDELEDIARGRKRTGIMALRIDDRDYVLLEIEHFMKLIK